MKSTLRALIALLLAALILSPVNPLLAQEAEGQEMNPGEVMEAIYDAVEAQDLDTAGEYLADDAVLVLVPPPSGMDGAFVGKEEVLGWFERLTQNGFAVELDNIDVAGNRVTMTNLTWVDDLPVAPVEFDGSGVVQDGKLKAVNWVMTPGTMAELDAAFAKMAQEELVRRWLYHWDTVNGELEGIDELLAEDFVSHNMPEGDRDVMIADVEAFRAGHPNTYFTVDELVIADGKAFLTTRYWQIPEDAPEGAEGEPASPPFLLVLGIEDGKITERSLYTPLEP